VPIYLYQCLSCLGEWKENHGMTEEVKDCFWCDSHNIHRKPTEFTNLSKKAEQKQKVGDLTNEFIENSKEDLLKQKEELDKNR
tara:strand:+ start:13193 stop:13441 length:249 start_codon:yes stop_codon:yes gene_type:complete